MINTVTYRECRHEFLGYHWVTAHLEERVEVLRERQTDDAEGRGSSHHDGRPREQKGGEVAERFADVRVLPARLLHYQAQLGVHEPT